MKLLIVHAQLWRLWAQLVFRDGLPVLAMGGEVPLGLGPGGVSPVAGTLRSWSPSTKACWLLGHLAFAHGCLPMLCHDE